MIKVLHIVTSVVTAFVIALFFIPDQEVSVKQHALDVVTPGQKFVVELTINKGIIDGFAQLQQYIPEGFTAEPKDIGKAKFSFEDHFVKITWFALPADAALTVSYEVTVGSSIDAGEKRLAGIFSYIEKDKPKTIDVTPVLIKVEPMPVAINNPDPVSAAIKDALSQPPAKDRLMASATSVPMPETGVSYKVQIAACRKDVGDMNYFNGRYHLQDHVSAEMHEGWHKYIIGSFNDYCNARNARVNTSDKVAGAFIVAYNNGERITVREALSVTKQKWLQ